mgnify:CR=1 FL=1
MWECHHVNTYEFSNKFVLRGIHYQTQNTQGKLIRVTNGEIVDVAVDLRRFSPTFGRWISFHMHAEKPQSP